MNVLNNKISCSTSTLINDSTLSSILDKNLNGIPWDSDLKVCQICKSPVKEHKTESKYYGTISYFPAECDFCKLKLIKVHEFEVLKEIFLLNRGKCSGYQNWPVKHHGIEVSMDQYRDEFSWQKLFANYVYRSAFETEKVGAIVRGNTGSGKTYIAKILHNELIRNFKNSTFIKAVDLAIVLRKETFSKDDYKLVLGQFKNIENLIVDDYGTQKNTEFVREAMFSIFDYRYENNKKTIITTNLDSDDIKDAEPRLYSRIFDPKWMTNFYFKAFDIRTN